MRYEIRPETLKALGQWSPTFLNPKSLTSALVTDQISLLRRSWKCSHLGFDLNLRCVRTKSVADFSCKVKAQTWMVANDAANDAIRAKQKEIARRWVAKANQHWDAPLVITDFVPLLNLTGCFYFNSAVSGSYPDVVCEIHRAVWAYGWCYEPRHEGVWCSDVCIKYKTEIVVISSVVDGGNDNCFHGVQPQS